MQRLPFSLIMDFDEQQNGKANWKSKMEKQNGKTKWI